MANRKRIRILSAIPVIGCVCKASDGDPIWTWYVATLKDDVIEEGGAYEFTPEGKKDAETALRQWLARNE